MLRHAVALVYVDDLAEVHLGVEDARHLAISLRLRDGEVVVASDGAGRYRACRAAGAAPRLSKRGNVAGAIRLEPDGPIAAVPMASPPVTIGLSLAKGDRTEWAVAKLTELGVDRIVPLVCERTVVRTDDQGAHRRALRLRRIARESAMQSRRVWLPEVAEPQAIKAAAMVDPPPALAEPGGRRLGLDHSTVLIGPEGGWSERERALGLEEIDLGPTVLRIETAALAAAVILTSLRSGTVAV